MTGYSRKDTYSYINNSYALINDITPIKYIPSQKYFTIALVYNFLIISKVLPIYYLLLTAMYVKVLLTGYATGRIKMPSLIKKS